MKPLYYLLVCLCCFMACTDKETSNNQPAVNISTSFLENTADNIIIPSFQHLKTQTDELHLKSEAFCANPTLTTLNALKAALDTSCMAWQLSNFFNFGPAYNIVLGKLSDNIGIFPVRINSNSQGLGIEDYINNGDTSFNNNTYPARGLYAVEYMIYSSGTTDTDTLLARYSTSAGFENRKAYLRSLTRHIKQRVDATVTGWASYRADFVSNTSKSIGSPISLYLNEFVLGYEAIKNFKVGVPSGRRAQTSTSPESVEGFYSGNSLKYLKKNIEAINNAWSGIGFDGTNRDGFEDYLITIANGNALVANTKESINQVKAAINAIPDGRLSDFLTINTPDTQLTNREKVIAAYDKLQQHLRFYKTDMASLLSVSITYQSGDGD